MQPEEGRHVLQYAARPASPPAPPPRRTTGTTQPPTLCARARAEDTNKCKNFLQLTQKDPEKCGSSNNFVKRCRASCHAQHPTRNYCAPTNTALQEELSEMTAYFDDLIALKGVPGEKGEQGETPPPPRPDRNLPDAPRSARRAALPAPRRISSGARQLLTSPHRPPARSAPPRPRRDRAGGRDGAEGRAGPAGRDGAAR